MLPPMLLSHTFCCLQKSGFTPDNEPEKGMWYWMDVFAMALASDADPILVDVTAGEEPTLLPATASCLSPHPLPFSLLSALFWLASAALRRDSVWMCKSELCAQS